MCRPEIVIGLTQSGKGTYHVLSFLEHFIGITCCFITIESPLIFRVFPYRYSSRLELWNFRTRQVDNEELSGVASETNSKQIWNGDVSTLSWQPFFDIGFSCVDITTKSSSFQYRFNFWNTLFS